MIEIIQCHQLRAHVFWKFPFFDHKKATAMVGFELEQKRELLKVQKDSHILGLFF